MASRVFLKLGNKDRTSVQSVVTIPASKAPRVSISPTVNEALIYSLKHDQIMAWYAALHIPVAPMCNRLHIHTNPLFIVLPLALKASSLNAGLRRRRSFTLSTMWKRDPVSQRVQLFISSKRFKRQCNVSSSVSQDILNASRVKKQEISVLKGQ